MNKELLINNVDSLCRKMGYSPKKAFELSGASKDYFVNLRRTQSKSLSDTVALAEFLHVSVSDLVGDAPKTVFPADFIMIWSTLDEIDRAQIIGFARGLAAGDKYIKTAIDLDKREA